MTKARTTTPGGRGPGSTVDGGGHAPPPGTSRAGTAHDVDAGRLGLVVLDRDGTMLWWDAAASELLWREGEVPVTDGDPLDLGATLASITRPTVAHRRLGAATRGGADVDVRVQLWPIADHRVAAILSPDPSVDHPDPTEPADGPHGRPTWRPTPASVGEPGSTPDGGPRSGEDRLRKILQNINDTITVLDASGRAIEGTGTVTSILGYPVSFWEGRDIFDLLHPDDLPKAAQLLAEVTRAPGARASSELRIRDATGTWQVIEGTGVNLLDDPDVGGILVTTRNITERRRTEDLAAGQAKVLDLVARGRCTPALEATAQLVVDQLGCGPCGIVVEDPAGPPLVASPGPGTPRSLLATLAERLHPAEVEARPPHPGPTDAGSGEVAIATLSASDDERGEPLARVGWGSCWSVPVTSSVGRGYRATITCLFEGDVEPTPWARKVAATAADLASIALDRQWSERQLADLAFYDTLTGLANRSLLGDRLEQAIHRARRQSRPVALMFLDLDRFKLINDTLGHAAGDQVLRELGQRLSQSVRPEDTVARFGGDEFVVLLEGVRDEVEAGQIAERLERCLEEPFLDGLYVTASVGIVVGDPDDATPATLLRDADIAMYRAKEQGRNRVELFDEAARGQLVARMRLEGELRRALHRNELDVAYQPTVALGSGRVVGVEVLVQWVHPERGLIDSAELLAVAEECGLSLALGAWSLDRALADLAAASAAPDAPAGRHLDLTVPLTPLQLAQPDLPTRLADALVRHGVPADQLVVALSEPLPAEAATARANLGRLVELGASLAVNDFGTGRSSVALLDDQPPISRVRISRSFVSQMLPSERTVPLVRAIVEVAHALGMSVLADGIDSAEQLAALRAMGCDLGQGACFSGPVGRAELAALPLGY